MKRIATVGLLMVAACGSSEGSSGGGGGAATSTTPTSTATGTAPKDAGTQADAATQASDASSPVSSGTCDASACASLVGKVERTSTQPTHGGKGPVYVAVFEGNPVLDAKGAVMVARTLLPNVDLSADNATIAYRVDGIPTSSTAYQVIAFLDDADAVSASNPAPASGDLISLQISGGISGIPVTVAAPGDTTLDLPLNAAMP